MFRQHRFAAIAAFAAALVLAAAVPGAAADPWHFSVSPYLWAPTINGSLNYDLPPGVGEGRLNVKVGPNDYLSHLKLAALVAGEARKGRYSLLTDVVYLDFENQESKVRAIDVGGDNVPVDTSLNRDTQTSLKGTSWMLAAGYSLNDNAESPVDVIGGFRYFGVDTSAKWELTGTVNKPGGSTQILPRSGALSKSTTLWDGIVGLRGRAKLGDRWSIPYYGDIGAGNSKLTWQAMTGVTRAFGWGDVGLVYRHLAYDEGSDGLMQNFSFSGPAVSFTFHF